MSPTLQVLYPTDNGTTFDFDYYTNKHMLVVGENIGKHVQSVQVVKGLAGGPDTPPGFHAVATMTFADQAALDACLAAAGPVIEDISNFFSGEAKMLIGQLIG